MWYPVVKDAQAKTWRYMYAYTAQFSQCWMCSRLVYFVALEVLVHVG